MTKEQEAAFRELVRGMEVGDVIDCNAVSDFVDPSTGYARVYERPTEVRKESINEEKRTVELSFSSEEPADRFFGTEILDHDKKSVRMARLNDGAPLLMNHDIDQHIGTVEHARISTDKIGRATVRCSKNKLADEKFVDVQDEILTKTSVRYRIHKLVLTEKNDDHPTFRAMSWFINNGAPSFNRAMRTLFLS